MNSHRSFSIKLSSLKRSALFTTSLLIAIFLCGSCANPDLKNLNGVWEAPLSNGDFAIVVIENGSYKPWSIAGDIENGAPAKFELDASKSPKQVALRGLNNDTITPAIYELTGDKLRVAFAKGKDDPMPTSFTKELTWEFERKGTSSNFAPTDQNYVKGVRTWKYWRDLAGIADRNQGEDPFKNAKTPDEALTACDDMLKKLQQLRTDVNSLKVQDVDSEATNYASEYLKSMTDAETLMREMSNIIKEAKEFQARSSSDETAGMALLDFFMGKPGATVDSLNAEAAALKNRMIAIRDKANAGGSTSSKLESEQVKVRNSLSAKYKREFKQFSH